MESNLQKLAENGILGLLLVISFIVIGFLYKELKSALRDRITDLKESRESIMEPLKGVQRTADLILKVLEDTKFFGKRK